MASMTQNSCESRDTAESIRVTSELGAEGSHHDPREPLDRFQRSLIWVAAVLIAMTLYGNIAGNL